MPATLKFFRDITVRAVQTFWILFKIMLPVMLVVKALQTFNLIAPIGRLLGPVMGLVGLPGDMGIVWATAMGTNLYAAMVSFVSMDSAVSLTAAQATVLTSMMLVAHALPVELRIAQKAGCRLGVMMAVRILGALGLGALLNQFFLVTGWLSRSNEILWRYQPAGLDWMSWALGQITNLLQTFAVIWLLLLVMGLLQVFKITDLIERGLKPILTPLGIGQRATNITVIGLTLGISYGGGLIIAAARGKEVAARDVFFALTLMGLAHSLIEDTLMMQLLGGHLGGILAARIFFAWLAVWLMAGFLRRVPEKICRRVFYR